MFDVNISWDLLTWTSRTQTIGWLGNDRMNELETENSVKFQRVTGGQKLRTFTSLRRKRRHVINAIDPKTLSFPKNEMRGFSFLQLLEARVWLELVLLSVISSHTDTDRAAESKTPDHVDSSEIHLAFSEHTWPGNWTQQGRSTFVLSPNWKREKLKDTLCFKMPWGLKGTSVLELITVCIGELKFIHWISQAGCSEAPFSFPYCHTWHFHGRPLGLVE